METYVNLADASTKNCALIYNAECWCFSLHAEIGRLTYKSDLCGKRSLNRKFIVRSTV